MSAAARASALALHVRLGSSRHPNSEGGSLTGLRFEVDTAPMRFYGPLTEREPEPHALNLRRV